MKIPLLPPALVTPFHGFAILSGGALLASLLWPDPSVGRALFLQALVLLQGILALQIGEAEYGYGPVAPLARLFRLFFFSSLAVLLVIPYLLVHRAETASTWVGFLSSLLFLLAHGFVWAGIGHALPRVVRSDGLRFLVKYGGLILVTVVPVFFALPVSGIFVLPALWEGRSDGWPGLALYLGLGGLSASWWWRKQRHY
ncbi:MAG: hypothetical protein NZ651_04870 [Candidatus Bipolaricaulota bacterium]|nr:hypothetical protein [Candidatus Bipolaricaulota bacterium]MDW8127086.1 hypothetical protein [Candidatus Bipolaricaulota bacterium]